LKRLHLEERLRRHQRRSSAAGERLAPRLLSHGIELGVRLAARLTGLHRRGWRNAMDLRVREVDFRLPDLPPAFDGYRILHLSDLHVGSNPAMAAVWIEALAGLACDLVAITGDFQCHAKPPPAKIGQLLAPLASALKPADGVVAVLGNHDSADLVEVLEGLGIRVLVNEGLTLARGDGRIIVVGTDDVHAFYTPAAPQVLADHAEGFRIALVHTVDLVDVAEAAGYALYLSGHTHAGQIALPGGRPILTALDRHRRLAVGVWRHGRLQGYTSAGTGSGAPAVRFNTRPEATMIRLVRG
jgi:predicted MPP superfamily phosphohydrolase